MADMRSTRVRFNELYLHYSCTLHTAHIHHNARQSIWTKIIGVKLEWREQTGNICTLRWRENAMNTIFSSSFFVAYTIWIDFVGIYLIKEWSLLEFHNKFNVLYSCLSIILYGILSFVPISEVTWMTESIIFKSTKMMWRESSLLPI